MIVLDEHLQTKGLEPAIRQWYAGSVVNILDLRPSTIIKDDAIPGLLAAQARPVFVTINIADFWLSLPTSDKYCILCFALATSEIAQIPELLRRLLRHTMFDTRAKRAGKMARITSKNGAAFYSNEDSTIRTVDGF